MMVANQNIPSLHGLVVPHALAGSSIDNLRPLGRPTKHVCPRVHRVFQNLEHGVVRGLPPFDTRADGALPKDRQLYSCLFAPKKDLARTSQFVEFTEEKMDRLGDAFIGIHLDATQFIPAVTGRQGEA